MNHTLAALLLLAIVTISWGALTEPREQLPADLPALREAVEDRHYGDWVSDSDHRLTGAAAADGRTYTVHQIMKVYYNDLMADWLASNRAHDPAAAQPVPDGAAMVAEVWPVASGGEGPPSGVLTMSRDSSSPDAAPDGWIWGQIVADKERWRGTVLTDDAVGRGSSLCTSCHVSAVDNLTFASPCNITGDGDEGPAYHPKPLRQTTGTYQSQVNARKDNALRRPLDDAAARKFVDFYREHTGLDLPGPGQLGKDEIVGFPFQGYDHVAARSQVEGFVTATQCQGCHDATAQLAVDAASGPEGWATPHMLFEVNPLDSQDPAQLPFNHFNASQYGEWSVSIMGLAGRDPVFHAQAETERVLHPHVDPAVIDNICYRCHGSMGQRQFHIDNGGDPTQVPGDEQFQPPFSTQPNFNHYMIYSTPDSKYSATGGPPYDQGGADPANAEYGALARDGISCLTCHHVGPPDGSSWDDAHPDWEVFYGYQLQFDVGAREPVKFSQLLSPTGFDYPFTSTFLYDIESIMTPTPDLNQGFYGGPTEANGANERNPAHTEALGEKTLQQSYMGQTNMCSSCHVVIVPKIPMDYPRIRNSGQITFDAEGNPIVDPIARYPGTDVPCADAPTTGKTDREGNPLYNPAADPGSEFAYEQTTFFEWASSSSFGHTDPQTSCTFCHMPSVFSHAVESEGAPARITRSGLIPDPEFKYLAVANTLNSGLRSAFGGEPGNENDAGAFPAFAYQAADTALSGQDAYPRHRLMGINLHVHQMFQQFPDILGLSPTRGVLAPGKPAPENARYGEDLLVPERTVSNLLNAEQTILTHAPTTVTVDLCVAGSRNAVCNDEAFLRAVEEAGTDELIYRVAVSNNAGHRFPTGAGFRRGFIELRLLDAAGETLWVSGSVNEYGAILDGATGEVLPCEFPEDVYINPYLPLDPAILQPHYGGQDAPYISRQDQVQIYEVRDLDEFRHLTSSTTRLFADVKDNRIPPAGWIPPVSCDEYHQVWGRARAEAMQGPVSEDAKHALEELESATPGTGTYSDRPETNGLSLATLTRITRPAGDAFTDPDFCTPNPPNAVGDLQGIPGTDYVWYRIPTRDVDADQVAQVVATMHYQLTPPGFLAARYADGIHFSQTEEEHGLEGNLLGNAINRLLYITSRLDTDIENSIPDQQNLSKWASRDWTMNIGFDCYQVGPRDAAGNRAVQKCAPVTPPVTHGGSRHGR